MVGRSLRAAIFASLVLAMWTLSRPAQAASAPYCDDRGASAIAAPPALQAPGEAIRRPATASCEPDEALSAAAIAPAHRSVTRPIAAADLALPAPRTLAPPPPSGAAPTIASTSRPHPGVSVRVERPPRD